MSGSSCPRIQVFRPTMEEFKNFSQYIEKIESLGAHKAGLAKIIPPEGWTPRKKGYDNIDLIIPAPISQEVTGSQGLYQQLNIQIKAMTVKEFEQIANSSRYATPTHFDYEDLERKYWKNITFNSPIYGADVSGSLYDDDVNEFNIQRLNTILDLVKEDYEIQIEGVNTAYLYFGMWKTTFAWHTEDMDLYSINYLHFGAPKSWYVVPPEHGRRLERLAAGFFHQSHQDCAAFLRHKMTIISPTVLNKFSIPFQKITQEPGEFMITFPFGYHSGFNHGFNCAESTNFALPRWVEYGKRTISCSCRNDCVKICMDIFVKKFQPDRYELWKIGKDIGTHPEEPTRHYAAPPPRKVELAILAQREQQKKVAKQALVSQKIKRHPISNVGKKELRSSAIHARESDEETELYDVDDALMYKKPKKTPRKKNKNSVNVRKIKSETKKEGRREMNIEIKKESDSGTDVQKLKDEQLNIKIDDIVHKVKDTVVKKENINLDNKFLLDSNGNSLKQDMFKERKINKPYELVGNDSVMDNPPELKPFWHPEVKTKITPDSTINSDDNSLSFQKAEELIINQYPHLKQAIHIGTFSIGPVNTKLESRSISLFNQGIQRNTILSENGMNDQNVKPKDLLTKSSFASNSAFPQTWRCEQTNNGIKIKMVPTETVQQCNKISPGPTANAIKSPVLEVSYNLITNQKEKTESSEQKNNSIEITEIKEIPNLQTREPNRIVRKRKSTNQSSASDSSPSGLSSKVQRADSSVKSWSHPIKDLWQHEPKNLEAEILFNEKLASIPPHCAICVIFTPIYNKSDFPSEPSDVPSYSSVRMPAYCYGNSLNKECLLDTNSLLRPDGTAPLLICSICKVCVHASCYGISMLPMGSWTCTKCSKQAMEAECCLCVLRGGALKPTNDNRWAHIICAVLIPETYFENTLQKQPINVSNIPPERQRLKCKYCLKASVTRCSKGICIQCLSGRCYLPFHVTCGYMAGVIFETNDWPEPIHMICTKHAAARRKPPKRQLTNVTVGEKVAAKHKNKRYYWASVKKKFIQEYYSILFEDNSTSNNTLPEDIVSKNIAREGPPRINEKVQVKWTDDKIYNGIFKGSQSVELYLIEFDDGYVLNLDRKQIYAADEELPKEVQMKLSHSSDRRNLDFSAAAEGKRIRITNHKYS
ncbi:lysine-specific demethylase 4C-like [Argiope bruennichi]|uniref:lysine-specific demethylase 4C-like n=1 Tax=Argiope bruennichi TaxID=94029 RepID=UPI00249431AA|nr:lysine-specific demethylase 4C-like [Argiope bruennichi]XP_055940868.1 lysine-specific demethylase 4C-like [Argiope bruennichi]XP_055940869.1 lysine-specific demethylase 4C-like [Argiope bruennichi]XP_055940870.1 lysine-specific demethylase 4C-like [Argiope bruennichi]XP_055940872.1 lysine-specific demethylase 4C-like [Argiope bruennichi]